MAPATLLSRRAFLGTTLALAACKNRKQVLEIFGFSMGTTYSIALVDHDNKLDAAEVKSRVDSSLIAFNKKLSNWDAGSEISIFNAFAGESTMQMSGQLSQVMQAAAEVNAASAGRFDTSIGPLIELWGFGAKGAFQKPNTDQIAQALELSGQSNTFSLDADTITKRQADGQVYLAGIGKGYGADVVGEVLEGLGVNDYMVEIGGDLFASGRNPDGRPWQIGIESPDPTNRSVMGVVGLSGMGLATSGDYRNYFEADGHRYSHLIDPTTGYPVDHKTASATVLDQDAMRADAWSTAMLILGREKGLEIAQEHDIAVQFIDHDMRSGTKMFTTSKSPRFEALTA